MYQRFRINNQIINSFTRSAECRVDALLEKMLELSDVVLKLQGNDFKI